MADATCSVDTCNTPAWCRGWCRKHYNCWYKRGDPTAVKRIWGDDVARFWSKVSKDGPLPVRRPDLGKCWVWLPPLNHGYGILKVKSRTVKAHGYAYELLVGPVGDGLELDHLCRNTACVNPGHLEPVTHAENMRRSPATQRAALKARARTHCINGHLLDEANAAISPQGHRRCRACNREKQQELRDRRKREAA